MATAASSTFEQAKAVLLKSDDTGRNLFDHLSDVLLRVLEEQPADALERFEQLSMQVKEDTFAPSAAVRKAKPAEFDQAETKTQTEATQLYKPLPPPNDEDGNPVEVTINEFTMPNVVEQLYYLEQCGVGFSREEGYRIQLALRRLGEREQLKSVRFWGKLFGVSKDYIVAEVEYKEGEHPKEKATDGADPDADAGADGDEAAAKPKKVEVPAEALREGANRVSYFVCNTAGAAWSLLPDVTPQQVNAARKIKKYLTGNLDAPVLSYPPFPGVEREYLRAQIARISAGATISPKGLIMLPGEEPGDGEAVEPFNPKPTFEAVGIEDLLNLENWVHHTPAILQQQGRTQFWQAPAEEPAEGDEPAEVVVEEGPEMGGAVSTDEAIIATPAWSIQNVSKYAPAFPVVLVRSNRWPGAVSYAAEGGKRSASIYIGYGHKFTGTAYSPALPAPVAPTVVPAGAAEAADPTLEDEKYFDELDEKERLAKLAAQDAGADGGDAPADDE